MAMPKGGEVETIRVQNRMWINPLIEIQYFDTVVSYQRALRLRFVEAGRWSFHNGGKTPLPTDLGPIPWPTIAVARQITGKGTPRTPEDEKIRRHRKQCESKVLETGVVGVNKRYNLWEATIYLDDGTQDKMLFATKLEAARWRNALALELYPDRPWMLCDLGRIEMEEKEVDLSTV